MARVVVTGGAGFIGSHAVRRFLDLGCEVVVLDDLSSGKRSNLPTHDRLSVVEGCVTDQPLLEQTMASASAVVHLAAIPSVTRSVEDPIGTHRVNYVGTMTVAQAAGAADVKRIVYASSAAVYGLGGDAPLSESAPLSPLSPYGVDKLAGEYFLNAWCALNGTSSVALRFFNVYGERQDPSSPYSGVISIFVNRLLSDQSITIFGDGHQTRDFIYAGDVAEAVCRAALETSQGAQIMNVATGDSITLLDLVEALRRVTGISARVTHMPPRAGDIRYSAAQVQKLEDTLGFRPKTSVDEGLTKLLGVNR